jgi:hypothetical protein
VKRLLFIGIFCILAFFGGCTISGEGAQSDSQEITCEKYEQLELGMHYREAVDIMGREGINIENRIAGTGHRVEIYSWRNPYGVSITCRFFDGKNLLLKEELGLNCTPED